MSGQGRRRGGATNRTGRSRHPSRFTIHWHYMLKCDAYRDLRPLARGVLMELKKRFNGRNNGEIRCSIRELTRELHCGKDTATAALAELVEHGFIRQAQPGSFQYKIRHAALWILTEEEYNGAPATKDFMRWRQDEKKPVPE